MSEWYMKPTATFEEMVEHYQSRRVARDRMEGRRDYIHHERWWWWNPAVNLDRLEALRARQAAQQDDAVRRP